MTANVMWVALPHQVDGTDVYLSVFVSPRLVGTTGRLDEFEDWREWTQTVAGLAFDVTFSGGPSFIGMRNQATLDTSLWGRLFPADTFVRPFKFDNNNTRDVYTYPVGRVLAFLKEFYQEVAEESGKDFPSIDDPNSPLNRLNPLSNVGDHVARSKFAKTGSFSINANFPQQTPDTKTDFLNAYSFYYRPGREQQPKIGALPKPTPPRPVVPEFDFHQQLSLLADNPAILRRLGLIIDVKLPLLDFPSIPFDGTVTVTPTTHPGDTGLNRSETRCQITDKRFFATPRDSFEFSEGLLRIDPELYDLYQVDVDGAAMKVIDFSRNLAGMRGPRRSGDTPDRAAVPSLRTGGISLARKNRAQQFFEFTAASAAHDSQLGTSTLTFDAEDVLRGFRVDIHDGEFWRSLQRRIGRYEFTATSGTPELYLADVHDEGYVKAASGSSSSNDPNRGLYFHEAVFGWDGWSLAASRPGKRVVEPGEGEGGSDIGDHDPHLGVKLPMVTTYAVEPGSLPRLRFGTPYKMRARLVDLAGNSLPFSENKIAGPTSEVEVYRRFEPVPTPTVLRRHVDTEGESLRHLVIRSDRDPISGTNISAAAYAMSPAVETALAGLPYTYRADTERHIAPPKGSLQQAELHSELDDAYGPAGDPQKVIKIAMREEGDFIDPMIVDVTTGLKTITQTGLELYPSGTLFPAQRGDMQPEGSYVLLTQDTVEVPYLADPISRGAAFQGLPGIDPTIGFDDTLWGGPWPNGKAFRLRLSEGAPASNFANGVLNVTLPKAAQVTVRLSSSLYKSALDELAVWHWMRTAKRNALEVAAIQGQLWTLTPYRELVLVHAVQHPLEAPVLAPKNPIKRLAETFAEFWEPIKNHAKSTGRLDVAAAWSETVDVLSEPGPTVAQHAAEAFGFDINNHEDLAPPTLLNPTSRAARRVSRHEFGDTKYRQVAYTPIATTRFREYFPESIKDIPDNIQTAGAPMVLKVLNSARPAAPEVLYIVPTFEWSTSNVRSGVRRTRKGNGLRVYLKRPWFSSGDGELLGVVMRNPPRRIVKSTVAARVGVHDLNLPVVEARVASRQLRAVVAELPVSSGSTAQAALLAGVTSKFTTLLTKHREDALDDPYKPYVTEWGTDPVWHSKSPEKNVFFTNFPDHTIHAAYLSIEELCPWETVAVAGHEVYYDSDRQLHYCDIAIDAGDSYTPFIRFALARFQPNSVPHAHLSRVVLQDFMQFLPDRTATVTVLRGAQIKVSLVGHSAYNYVAVNRHDDPFSRSPAPSVAGSRQVIATLETEDFRAPGGWVAVGKPQTLALKKGPNVRVVTWESTFPVPEIKTGRGNNHRIRLEEFEIYFTDHNEALHGPSHTPILPGSPIGFTRSRLVYVDHIPIVLKQN